MKIIQFPKKPDWSGYMQRPMVDQEELFSQVNMIFDEIKENGDLAVKKYSHFFDRVDLNTFLIGQEAGQTAAEKVDKDLQTAIILAKNNIEAFHKEQIEPKNIVETTAGIKCWRESRPIERVGIYVPGGTAPLFSSVLMLGVPAAIAGCKEIVLCTPPNEEGEVHPAILFAANLAGINQIYAVGGIQAIGAMTFGTESIPQVDKIFGPGNQYVTAAKQVAQNFGVAIDMPAGPSELLVIADQSCNPVYVAADLLSQAEHGPDSQVILLSDNAGIVDASLKEIRKQLKELPRMEVAEQSLQNSKAIVLNSIDDCISFSNQYAPEHLILAVQDYESLIPRISNAGSVFLGNYSCESAGDYATGTNHTLPTNGYARNYSGVSLDSFVKKITFQLVSSEGLRRIGPAVEIMAEAEHLAAHKNAVSIRLQDLHNE
jgi:histidinol dehydrogenase